MRFVEFGAQIKVTLLGIQTQYHIESVCTDISIIVSTQHG